VRVIFFGSPEFAVPALEAVAAHHDVALVVSQPDRPAGRGRQLQAPAVKEVAARLGLPVEQPVRVKDPALAERLAALAPDVFVVAAYGRILPPALLAVPRLGPWNIHASLLPRYRGAGPIQWAVIRGEAETGVSIMRMEEGLDTGPVAAVRREPITGEDTAGTLSGRLARAGAELLLETLPAIASGTVSLTEQDHARATLAPMLSKQDGLLDFRQPAALVSAQARGVDPWPGAFALYQGQPVKLYRPALVPGAGQPGEVLGLGPAGLGIACGPAAGGAGAPGAVAFAELQLPGRKRLPAAAVLAGHPLAPGTVFAGKV
jgi:methionyl-tRNA formyltransferase